VTSPHGREPDGSLAHATRDPTGTRAVSADDTRREEPALRFEGRFDSAGTTDAGGLTLDVGCREEAIELIVTCPGDFNRDCAANVFDFITFQHPFRDQDPPADCNEDGPFDSFGFVCFHAAFTQDSPGPARAAVYHPPIWNARGHRAAVTEPSGSPPPFSPHSSSPSRRP